MVLSTSQALKSVALVGELLIATRLSRDVLFLYLPMTELLWVGWSFIGSWRSDIVFFLVLGNTNMLPLDVPALIVAIYCDCVLFSTTADR